MSGGSRLLRKLTELGVEKNNAINLLRSYRAWLIDTGFRGRPGPVEEDREQLIADLRTAWPEESFFAVGGVAPFYVLADKLIEKGWRR